MIGDFLTAGAVAAAISAAACRLMIAAGVTDSPDLARKMHPNPTATSGGLGIAIGFVSGLVALTVPNIRAWSEMLSPQDALNMAGGAFSALAFMSAGLYDDARPMRARPKFLLFAIAAFVGVLVTGRAQEIAFAPGLVLSLHPWAGLVGSALFLFVMANAVNFLDGANGLALGSVAISLCALFPLALMGGATHAAALALVGVGSIAGFLLWNFPDGRLFAGDAGALFAGVLAGCAALIAVEAGALSVFTAVNCFFPILADALLTLAWRASKRLPIWDGHREHLFQILLRSGWTHVQVTSVYWAATLFSGVFAIGASLWARHDASGLGGFAPFALFCALIGASLLISARIRKLALRRGLHAH